MDFEKVCTIFTMQEPYYGILLSAMDRFPTKDTQTIGVRRSGNMFRLGYNPDFIEDKDLPTMIALLKHETLHLALNHLTLWDETNCSEEEHFLHNLAGDLEANCYIDFSNVKGINPMLPEKFGWDRSLGTMEYYKRLSQLNQQQQKQQAKKPSKPCNGGQGGSSGNKQTQNQNNPQNGQNNGQNQNEDPKSGGTNSGGGNQKQNGSGLSDELKKEYDQRFDDHSKWPKGMTEEQQLDMKQAIDDLCVFAAEEVEKSCGKIPGEMVGRITAIREKKKPRPVTDWKKHFRRYIGNEFSDQIKKSRKRESMRFPDAAGNRHKRKSHILVAIDTSGSVSMPEYREFLGQLRTMKDITFHVVECDAAIQYEYDFTGMIHETLHGGGGTSFYPPIKMYLVNRKKYEGIVYFTDGYCDVPNITPKETLWVISSNGCKDRQKFSKNGAKVLFIPPKQQ